MVAIYAPLHGAGMPHVTVRLADDISSAVDALAKAAGMTRSAWINRAIKDALVARPDEIRVLPEVMAPTKTITMRFPVTEIEAMESVAARAGLTRAQWLKRTVRWQLWDRAGELRLIPSSYRSIIKLVSQVRAIGRSLNQSVKAMNAANRPESRVDIGRIAEDLLKMEERIGGTVGSTAAELATIVSGEVYYWTERQRKPPRLTETDT
jgi:predicted transcriptional regulator